MSNDISTSYTKEMNMKCGRKGYHFYKHEKEDVISPRHYGMFLLTKRKEKVSGRS